MFHAMLEAEIKKRGRGAQAWLARAVGLTPTYVGKILRRENYGTEQTRRDIAKALGFDYEDFLEFGRRILESRGETINRIPKAFTRDYVCPIVVLASEAEGNIEIRNEDYYAAPLIAGAIAAGEGRTIFEDQIQSLVWIYAPELRDRRQHTLIAVMIDRRSDGESMIPTLMPGDIVLVDRDDPGADTLAFRNGAIYAIRTQDGGCQVKRLYRSNGEIIIASDNREVAPAVAWTTDIERLIIGRVVWGWRNLLEV